MLQYKVDSLDGMDDAKKALYVESEGSYRLDIDATPTKTDDDVAALKRALEAERREHKKSRSRIHEGIDPDEYQELKAAADKAEEDRATKAGEFDSMKKQLMDKQQKALDELTAKISERDRMLDKEIRQNGILTAANAAGVLPEMSGWIMFQAMQSTKLTDEYKTAVIDPEGNQRVNAKGEPMSIDDMVAEMAESPKYAAAFRGTSQSGMGIQRGNGNGGFSSVTKASLRKNIVDQANFVHKHGKDKYDSLPEG